MTPVEIIRMNLNLGRNRWLGLVKNHYHLNIIEKTVKFIKQFSIPNLERTTGDGGKALLQRKYFLCHRLE